MPNHGFTLISESSVAELASTARLWRHEKTGAELLSFTNKDENKVFGVSFRTPPPDSTGVAHILEHSVLCGSEKYPVREPFVELLKGSLQTFLNAFTYPDKTCYPVASANLQDFYNLTDVYLDAVFFPRISEDIFMQEGHHLEPEGDGFAFKGVVYNEMKGAFSAPESVLSRYSLHALFPDTVYSLESGGDPKHIPDLTYEGFKDFHSRYYHPSNGRFFFWGDDPEDARLEKLGAVLNRFSVLKVESSIGLQAALAAPRSLQVPFAASEDEKGMAVLNWLGPDVTDVETVLGFRMLEHILLELPASPLRRALIESGLGEDLAGQGLETELRQLTFDAGLKGVDPKDFAKVEKLVLDTLNTLADNGIPADAVNAAVNSVEFALRENNSGRFPVGLAVMLRSLTTWLHNADPLAPLRFEAHIKAIKEKAGKGYFEGLIRTWLLENTHRVLVTLVPDKNLEDTARREESARIAEAAAGLSDADKKEIVESAARLSAMQGDPDSPEALATIPRLGVADLPKANARIPEDALSVAGRPCWFHGLPTGGIVYAEACFDLSAVPQHLFPLLPLFSRALLEMGTKKRGFAELNTAIAGNTGGMEADPLLLSRVGNPVPAAKLVLSGKAAPDKAEDLFALMAEVLAEADFSDMDRFAFMVLEDKARLEHGLVPSGHQVAASRLRASLSQAGMLLESMNGVSALPFLRELTKRMETDRAGVAADLEMLRRRIITRQGMDLNITALPEQRGALLALAEKTAAALPDETFAPETWKMNAPRAHEALILPAQVNYVGKGVNLFEHGYAPHGSAAVVLKHLRTGYLWEKVRVQGGAYGCVCSLDRMSGAFCMVSYRDPNILPTLAIYDAAAEHLQKLHIGKAELDAAIVGAIGELDTYLLPDAKGFAAYSRRLAGDTEAIRAALRAEMLATTPEDFNRFGQALAAFAGKGIICSLGGSTLEKTAEKQGWDTVKIL